MANEGEGLLWSPMKSTYTPREGFVSNVRAELVTEIQLEDELVSVKP
jgi:hypothetical protein